MSSTPLPYVAIAKTSFDYTDGEQTFHVHYGNAFTGVLFQDDTFCFVIYLYIPGQDKYRMEVEVPANSTRFSFHPITNAMSITDANERDSE